eukprot:gnl/MRDRNA2_/MRDRNA2_80307_c0_seq2.p2 gnl/MRDRNA2_/MRDRNA2_80307_c0~~gnl/MRDRNA2_/MRDRNA2_80307_c0_seq2.p2  ORF type:complete len:108 (+),score=21.72 gnl/MRDRNA2_/MRDRNA2_80307_c0_seq2:61-384(+)
MWAMYRVVVLHSPDLGCLTFFAGIIASVNGWRSATEAGSKNTRQRWMMLGACLAVAVNYFLGFVLVFLTSQKVLLAVYFAVGCLFWNAAGIYGTKLIDRQSGGFTLR